MLFVLNSLAIGGSETKIIRIANALAHSGVKVELAYLNPPETGLKNVDPIVRVTNLRRRGKYSISSLRRLRDLVCREEHTVIAVNLYPLLYVIPAVKFGISKSVRAFGLVNTSVLMKKDRLFGRLYASFLKQCDGVIFGSTIQRTNWVEKYGIPDEKSQVIYNGVDSKYYNPTSALEEGAVLRKKLGIPNNAMVIGGVGRLAPEKSFDLLINSSARLNAAGRETYTVFTGQGEELESLELLARTVGVADKTEFLGLLNDVRSAISIMDVFVLPSSAVETFSNAALEAMAMGRAVVLSEIGGAAEMVEHGKSGMLFPIGNVDILTDILTQLHDSSEMRQSLGTGARERVVSSFGFFDMVNKYKSLLSA